MGVIVAISTCGPQLEVALRREVGAVPSTVRLAGISPRSTLLLAAVDLLMEDAGETPDAIDRVVVSRGPGSFTGIRAGLATAAGLAEATGAECLAYDSLLAQAARCGHDGEVWSAQPGRRGEVYACRYRVGPGDRPDRIGEIEVLTVGELGDRAPWVAAEALDMGVADRVVTARSAAEALIVLWDQGVPAQPLEPLYVEGPPIRPRESADG
jgi:tRNA threonylcarbamoyl adenosine modification protein YeaZ